MGLSMLSWKLKSSLCCPIALLFAALSGALLTCPIQAQGSTLEANSTINYDFNSWGPCGNASFEYINLSPDQDIHPCILYDIEPPTSNSTSNSTTRSAVITLVQVTPAASSCYSMRDGAVVSVELINAENEGRGVPVGFYKDYYIQFRLVSIVSGNADYISRTFYGDRHSRVLASTLAALKPQYIIGTCSFASIHEDKVAGEYKTMLLAQVGPPSYYQSGNPYLFGFHLNSDSYPLPAVRALGFTASKNQPIVVMYRTISEFFYSTCRSAIDTLHELGFTNVLEMEYVPDDDHNGDGIQNQFDPVFLHAMADQACPPNNNTQQTDPAIFACFLSEQDLVLPRLIHNGCRPSSIWLTAATWGWATANPEENPYMQGGGQWHSAFTYGDEYYASGQDLLGENESRFGYFGTYDFVVSYAIPMLFLDHLKATYRVTDDPDPAGEFGSTIGYEKLRRSMVILDAENIFGPVSFDDNQRNIGRAPAGTQWLPESNNSSNQSLVYDNSLVSPDFMAQAAIVLPSPSAQNCAPGQFVDQSLVRNSSSLLTQKCSQCPIDTITYEPNQRSGCLPCPVGSTTEGQMGETKCYRLNDNLIPKPVRVFGYCLVGITWALGIMFMAWLIRWRDNTITQIAQIPFMFLICLGAIVSSSTIIALSWQAGSNEDTSAATAACQAAPFLYTIGWVLQYGTLSAKTYRLFKVTRRRQGLERVTVTAFQTSWIIALVLALDLVVVITWTLVKPLEYRRETTSVSIGEDHVVTTSSYGFCSGPEGTSIWAFAGPLAGVHFVLMIITNWLLYKISYLEDRYQEHKYVALASMFVFEVLVVGLPVLFSVGDNTAAVFLVLTGIIALNDVGMLCFLFLPKVYYRRQGLMTGVGIGESMRKSSYRKAKNREIQRSSGGIESNNSMAGSSRYGGSARDLQSSGGLTATETAEALKRQKSNDALDSDNIHDLKYAILEERCRFLEQKTIELERALEKANGPRVEEEALLEEKETAPTPDSNFTDSG